MSNFIRQHSTALKSWIGTALVVAAAVLFSVDADDGDFSNMTVVAGPLLLVGLTLIVLAVVNLQTNRIRSTIWNVADAVREGEAERRRLRSVGRR